MNDATITITTVDESKDVYRQKDLRQSLYDAGEIVMDDVLVNLHGDDHRARRRLENRLFRRDTLVHYERDLFPSRHRGDAATVRRRRSGRARGAVSPADDEPRRAQRRASTGPRVIPTRPRRLYGYMMKFIEGATLAHTTRDQSRGRG